MPEFGLTDAAVEDVDVPARLVQLRVVDVVAGRDRERGRAAVDRAPQPPHLLHRLLHHERDEPLLRPVAGVERAAVAVDELDARGRLLVDELEVRQLDEREKEAAA